jgi:hypothetical protein
MINLIQFSRVIFVKYIAVVFLCYSAVEGVGRYLFFSGNISVGPYVLKLIMILAIVLKINLGLTKQNLYIFSFILIFLINGSILNGLDRAIVSVFVFIPLIFFLLYPVSNLFDMMSVKLFLSLAITIFLGLVIDMTYQFPWEDFVGNVNGVEVISSRLSWVNGVERLAGFGRSSFEVAIYVSFLCLIVISKTNVKKIIYPVIVMSLISIYLTTSKGSIFALSAALLFVFVKYISHRLAVLYFCISILLGNIILLFSAFSVDVSFLIENFFSFYQRIEFMWPNAFKLISDSSNVFGLGFGSVGVSASQDFQAWAAIDNFWLYVMSMFGFLTWGVLVISLLIFSRYLVSNKNSLLYVFLFINGITTNMIEAALGQVIVAMLIINILELIYRSKIK